MTRVAVVTGANKGIGYEIAKQLGEAGLKVIIGCRDVNRGEDAKESLSNSVPNASFEFRPLDISNSESINSFVTSLTKDYDTIEVLVNNAAIAFSHNDTTPHHVQAIPTLGVNYTGTMEITKAMLPLIRKAQNPRIVFVASQMGHLAHCNDPTTRERFAAAENGGLTLDQIDDIVKEYTNDVTAAQAPVPKWPSSNYSFSKMAVIAATKSLAASEASNGILINCCCPGYCDTDMTNHNGPRPASVGAQTPVLLALLPPDSTVTGEFWKDGAAIAW